MSNPPPVRLAAGARVSLSECYRSSKVRPVYGTASKRCLVLLLPRVSGSGTMNDSPCVSTSTTTRRPPSRPRSIDAVVARDARPVRQRVERASLRAAGQGGAGRGAIGGRGADQRRSVGDRLHERRHRSPTTSRFAAPPRRSSRRGRRHLIASAIEHEAVLNTLKALARRGWRTTLAAGRSVGHRLARSAARGDRPTTRRSSR